MSLSSRPTQGEITSTGAVSPSTQYPFPTTELPQRGQSVQRWNLRRESTASSITSIGGILDGGWGRTIAVAEAGPNAISTLLQPPIVTTGLQAHGGPSAGGFRAPTQKDIPPVALTNIPHIDAKSFHPYLTQVGSLYEAFQRAKQENEGDSQLFRREKKEPTGQNEDAVPGSPAPKPVHSPTSSMTMPLMSPIESPVLKRRQSGQRRPLTITPLSTIPTVYSEEDFHLENPRTFEIVSEHSEIIRDPNAEPTGRKTLATNAILQEKLSWYMDTVEVHLINSISTASKSFFSALGSLRELHAEAAESVDRIQELRRDLARLDKELAKGGLKVLNMKQRRNNIRQLAETIMQLEEIVSAVQKCEDKVNNGEIDNVLDDIDAVENLICGRHSGIRSSLDQSDNKERHLRDLGHIKALDGAFEDLNQLRYQVGKGFESRFHSTLIQDLRRHVNTTETNSTLQRWGMAFSRVRAGQRRGISTVPSYMSQDPNFRAELESEMKALALAKHTLSAATTFRTVFLREMKNMIRKQLPSSNDDDNVSTISASTAGGRQRSQQEKSSTLARNLRAMDAEDSYSMLADIYTNISEGLRRLSVQVKVVLDITSSMSLEGLKSPPKSPEPSVPNRRSQERSVGTMSVQAEVQQALDLSSLLGEAVDAVQQQIAKVVRVRSQQTSELPPVDFLRFFTLHRLFVDECEAISGRSGLALKSVVDNQIKDYVSTFTNSQKQNLVSVMDADRWDAKDFGDQENALLSRVTGSSTAEIAVWTDSCVIWQQASDGSERVKSNVPNGTSSTLSKDKVRSATIDEQKFILPESGMAILRLIETFQHLTAGIPGMAVEIASSLLDCLKLFNSRSSQLILGAGATRSAGLKNITTKHLALSSQSLGFVISLVPYVREFYRRQLPSSSTSQIMSDFDKVKRLFQEHQNSIHEKLVDIMNGRASMHVAAMKKIDWEQAAQNKAVPISPYIEVLTKETATLQKVLVKHLPEPVVSSIMIPVFSSYKDQWSKAYQEVSLRSVAAKDR